MPLVFDGSADRNIQRRNERYLVLQELGREAVAGMGDVEFCFSYLCISSDGEQCIIRESYIQPNIAGRQGFELITADSLCSWDIQILPVEDESARNEQRKLFLANDLYTGRVIYDAPIAVSLKGQKPEIPLPLAKAVSELKGINRKEIPNE